MARPQLRRRGLGRALAGAGGRAFVSPPLRPFVIAALADRDPSAPTLVVAGDDRGARDLAQDLRRQRETKDAQLAGSRKGAAMSITKQSWFDRHHPLGGDAKARCTHRDVRVMVGGTACGQCWQAVIEESILARSRGAA